MNYYQLMAAYNRWMNRKLYDVCAEIPDDRRREDLGAFFKSIHGTLNHILLADYIWMDRFNDQPRRYKLGDEIHADFEELRTAREEMDGNILDWVETLTDKWLEEPLQWVSGIDGKTRRVMRRILVTHMFNHQTHHRGQLTTLITQLGYEPGVTDIPAMPGFTLED
jgi:uncharacterized damage-inducible protein DinB